MKILFVCTGNTCRSPMAEALAKSILGENEDRRFFSRGLYAAEGEPASAYAQKAVQSLALSLDAHRSKKLTLEDVNGTDVIVTMTENHKNMILFTFHQAEGKVYTLKEYTGGGGDVIDPFGGDYALYLATLKEIEQAIRCWPEGR